MRGTRPPVEFFLAALLVVIVIAIIMSDLLLHLELLYPDPLA